MKPRPHRRTHHRIRICGYLDVWIRCLPGNPPVCLDQIGRNFLPPKPLQIRDLQRRFFGARFRRMREPPRGDLWGAAWHASSDIEGTLLYPKKAPEPSSPHPGIISPAFPRLPHRIPARQAHPAHPVSTASVFPVHHPTGFPVGYHAFVAMPGSGRLPQVHGNPHRPRQSLHVAPGRPFTVCPLS